MVLPVESFEYAKPDLAAVAGYHRRELAHAFFLDTLRAVRATACVGLVVVATRDPLAARQARTLGAVTGHVPPRADVRETVRRGVATAAGLVPAAPVCVLAADLPTLRPSELHQVLTVARMHPRTFVPDRSGRGVTALTSGCPRAVDPAFGSGACGQQRRGGALELTCRGTVGLRLDVDAPGDLVTAHLRGLGPFTRGILGTWVHPSPTPATAR